MVTQPEKIECGQLWVRRATRQYPPLFLVMYRTDKWHLGGPQWLGADLQYGGGDEIDVTEEELREMTYVGTLPPLPQLLECGFIQMQPCSPEQNEYDQEP